MIWSLVDGRFRDAEGALKGAFVLPWASGIALALAGWTSRTKWFRAGCWAALAILGHAASLMLIDAGPLIHYQHYRPDRLTWPVILILTGQAGAVAVAATRLLPDLLQWFRDRGFAARIAVVFGFTLLLSAAVSERVGYFLGELSFAAAFQIIQIANVLLAARAIPREIPARIRSFINRWFEERPAQESPGFDRIAITGAVWVVAASAVLSFFVYERHPHIPDEVVYVYHARYLAAGMLKMPMPDAPAAFDLDLMNYEGDAWFCPVPPGWPFLLSIGVLFGAPWLVNPLLAGVNVLLSYTLLRELYSRQIARIGVLLLCVSPWHIFMAMNFMTHTFTLACALAGGVAIVRWRRTGYSGWAAAAGVAAGISSLIRPLDGLIAFMWLTVLGAFVEGKRVRPAGAAVFLVTTALVGAAALPYNKLLTGDPFKAPIMAYTDKYYGPDSNALGFGPNRGLGWALDPFPGHSPADAVVNAALNGFSLQNELFGWGIGSLSFLILIAVMPKHHRSDWLLLSLSVLVTGAYCLYYYSGGPDFGARYWYLMLPACIALTARGIQFLQSQLTPERGVSVLLAAVFLGASTVAVYMPWRAVDKYWHYLLMRRGIQNIAGGCASGRTLVLVRGARFPDYSSAAVYNPIHLDADVPVYAWDKDPEVRLQALKAFSDRSVCIVQGPTLTRQGYHLIEGPVSAATLLAKSGILSGRQMFHGHLNEK
jgi:hypothetical protein